MAAEAPLDPARDVDGRILELLEQSLERPVAYATRSMRFSDFGFDDLTRAHFAFHVRKSFGVDVDPDVGPGPETLGDIIERIERSTYWTYPAPPQGTALDLARGDFGARFFRPPLHALARAIFRTAFRFRAEGRHHVPKVGPFVLVANHSGHPDAPALMASVPLGRVNEVHPLAAADYFWKRKIVGGLVHLFVNALPLDRAAGADLAMKAGLDLLREGRGIILFPEGTRSTTGEMAPFKKGVGLLLAGKPYPAIPAYITGSRDVLPKGASWPRMRPLRVRLGAPVTYEREADTRDGWKRVALDLEQRVRSLAPARPPLPPPLT